MQKSLFQSRKFLKRYLLTNHHCIPNLCNVSIIDFGACLTFLMFHFYHFMIVTCVRK